MYVGIGVKVLLWLSLFVFSPLVIKGGVKGFVVVKFVARFVDCRCRNGNTIDKYIDLNLENCMES